MPARPWRFPSPALIAFLTGLLLGGAACSACWWAAGATLGLYLGGVILSAIILPPLAAAGTSNGTELRATIGVVTGIAIVWLASALAPQETGRTSPELADWFACTIVLGAFDLLLCGMTAALIRARLTPPLAAFVTFLAALAWLTWPVWLGGAVVGHDNMIYNLTCWHPLTTINSVLAPTTGFWAHQPLAYRLTELPNQLPAPKLISISVMAHSGLGVTLMILARLPKNVGATPASPARPM